MAQLTDRQREIKTRLTQGMGAREIADELGITRNAVYQQIQRLRKYGELDPGFTPTGQPPREQVPGQDVLMRLVGGNDRSLTESETAAIVGNLALVNELRYVRDQLSAIVQRLTNILPS